MSERVSARERESERQREHTLASGIMKQINKNLIPSYFGGRLSTLITKAFLTKGAKTLCTHTQMEVAV